MIMLKLSILIAIVFAVSFIIVRDAFRDYNWKKYTMKHREYNEQEREDLKKEENSKYRF